MLCMLMFIVLSLWMPVVLCLLMLIMLYMLMFIVLSLLMSAMLCLLIL